jgi:hypothetical protein
MIIGYHLGDSRSQREFTREAASVGSFLIRYRETKKSRRRSTPAAFRVQKLSVYQISPAPGAAN